MQGEHYWAGCNYKTVVFLWFAGHVHDAVLLWAYGVNKTVEQGYAPDDGFRVTSNIFNMVFDGISGKVAIDSVGDRKLDQRSAIHGTMHTYCYLIHNIQRALGQFETWS